MELTITMVLVQDASAKHSAVSVSSVIHRQSVGQVVDERQLWAVGLVVSSHQHVHLVSVASAQVISQVLAGEVSGRLRAQLVAVSHLVQQNVFRNVLDELNGVAGIADGSDHQRVGDFEDLVLIYNTNWAIRVQFFCRIIHDCCWLEISDLCNIYRPSGA